jgi:hypothetical protein
LLIFARGTRTSDPAVLDAAAFDAGVFSEPQLSQPPQAPFDLSADAAASHRAIRPRPRKAGARAVTRLNAANVRLRKLRGPSEYMA